MKKLAENPLFVFLSGLFLTAVVYFVSIFMGHQWQLNSEKHDNHIFTILVHMAGNLMGLVSVIMMTMSFNA